MWNWLSTYIYIYISYFLSLALFICLSGSLTLSHACSDVFRFFFLSLSFHGFIQCNKGDRPEITITKKKRKKKRKIRESCVFCPPSLAVTAQRTLSALWWDIIKEEVVEAPCLWSSPSGWGSPEPRLKAWCPRSPWRRSQQSLAFRPRRKTSSLLALVWTAAAPARTDCGPRARSPAPAVLPLTFSARSTWWN